MATTEELRQRLQRAIDNQKLFREKAQSVSRELRGEPEPEGSTEGELARTTANTTR